MRRINNRLGGVIKEKRKVKKITQEQLAEKLDVSPGFVGQVERGETLPSVETLEQIINLLDIDPRLLFLEVPHGDPDYASLCVAILQMPPEQRRFLLALVDFLKDNYK